MFGNDEKNTIDVNKKDDSPKLKKHKEKKVKEPKQPKEKKVKEPKEKKVKEPKPPKEKKVKEPKPAKEKKVKEPKVKAPKPVKEKKVKEPKVKAPKPVKEKKVKEPKVKAPEPVVAPVEEPVYVAEPTVDTTPVVEPVVEATPVAEPVVEAAPAKANKEKAPKPKKEKPAREGDNAFVRVLKLILSKIVWVFTEVIPKALKWLGKRTKILLTEDLKAVVTDNDPNLKFPFAIRILIITIIPMLLIFVCSVIITRSNIRNTVEEERLVTLTTAASAVRNSYDYAFEGDYKLTMTNVFMKGDVNLSNNQQIVDKLYEETGVVATISYNSTRKVTSIFNAEGERIVGTSEADAIFEHVSTGESYYGIVEIEGVTYDGYYEPLRNSDGTFVGMVFVGIDRSEVEANIASMTGKVVAILSVIFVVGLILVPTVSMDISSALRRTNRSLKVVALGDLTVEVNERDMCRSDEVGNIARATEVLRDNFKNLLGHIENTVVTVKDAAENVDVMSTQSSRTVEDVGHAVEEIATGATTQAHDTQTASEHVDNMGNLIQNIVEEVAILTSAANKMGTAEAKAQTIMEELAVTAERTSVAVEQISAQTEITNKSTKEISKAVELITSIASQTTLLSLNASIEAARAGEAGRGFAVVASEIQKLAEQSNQSAVKIQKVIEELTVQSNKTVNIMATVKEAVNEQEKKLAETREIFGEVRDGVKSSLIEIDSISGKSTDLSSRKEFVVDLIDGLSAISEENAASTEQTMASTEELSSMMIELASSANKLNEMAAILEGDIKKFTI